MPLLGCKSIISLIKAVPLNSYRSGITTSLALILFASSIGRWIDHAPSRLRTLLTTVTVNRIVVIIACFCWVVIITQDGRKGNISPPDPSASVDRPRPLSVGGFKDTIFLLILALGVIERLSRLANLISIERDWVPVLATTVESDKGLAPYDLTQLNAAMSRIDLICKLGAPIVMSMFMSATRSSRLGAVAMIALNCVSWPLEYWTARTVWQDSTRLREKKAENPTACAETEDVEPGRSLEYACVALWVPFYNVVGRVSSWIRQYGLSLKLYFATDIWMASLAVTGLHFSILVFSGTLTVFLVNSGFSLMLVTWAEIFSAMFELGSTYVFPWGVRLLATQSTSYQDLRSFSVYSPPASPLPLTCETMDESQLGDEPPSRDEHRRGVSTLGMWALAFMLICLVGEV